MKTTAKETPSPLFLLIERRIDGAKENRRCRLPLTRSCLKNGKTPPQGILFRQDCVDLT